MVFHYTIRGGPCLNEHSHITLESSDITCYVGKDKHENEYLIKYGWPGDVWFHVDSLSSAHVYFRVCSDTAPVKGIPIDNLPTDAVYDMMQIVKHNSISGCKLASTKIVYTAHSNLKKTFQMESGTVTFHDTKLCRYGRCDKDRQRVKELEKTKFERVDVDFFEEMKANERRIIERKKLEREEKRATTSNDNDDSMGIYDPITDDLRTSRIKATRQGDKESGLDFALDALKGVKFAAVPVSKGADDDDDGDESDTADDNTPDWIKDINSRLLEKSPDVQFLRERGYSSADASATIRSYGSLTKALRSLWQTGATPWPTADSAVSKEATEVRLEEKEVLQAIFGEDEGVEFSEDETAFDAVIPITSFEPPDRYESPPALLLEVYADDGIAPLYPHAPPVLALLGGGLSETLLKELTNRLRMETLQRIEDEPGEPQIFNLISFIAEEAEKVVEEEAAALEALRKQKLKEQQLEAESKRKEEAAMRKTEGKSTVHKNEQERREYAKEVIAKVGSRTAGTEEKKTTGGKRYNTGVSDQSLIDDLFK
jgi:hypothetical protein